MGTKNYIGRRGILKLGGAGALGMVVPVTAKAEQLVVSTAEPVWLFDTQVAGTQYYDCDLAMTELEEGTPLVLRREPGNPHDELAIEVLTTQGLKIGYVPRRRNTAVARLLDAGRDGVVSVVEIDESRWDPLRVSVTLGAPVAPGNPSLSRSPVV